MRTDRTTCQGGTAIVMEWLREGVPLTLLMDLWDPRGLRPDDLMSEQPQLPRPRHPIGGHAAAY